GLPAPLGARVAAEIEMSGVGAWVVALARRGVPARGSGTVTPSSIASDIPSRTVITFAQFLQRILRILPRTRSSPIEYRVLQRSHRNFTPPPSERRLRRGGPRDVTRALIVPEK